METKKPKTAIGKFIDELPSATQDLFLNAKHGLNITPEKNRFGESLIFELPSGKKIKFIAKLVDPKKCKIWKGNIRLQEFLNDKNTKELKEKITKQGQLVPVLARPIKDGSEYSHEVIYGSRRHYVCSSLGVHLKILEADLDDSDALVFMDAENSGRKEISPYEMAMAYKFWLDNEIFKSQGELSEKIGITRSWLNKIISLSKIPKEIIFSVSGPNGLLLKDGLILAKKITESPEKKDILIQRSVLLEKQGASPELILKDLLNDQSEYEIKRAIQPFEESISKTILSKKGKPICTIKTKNGRKTIILFNKKTTSENILKLLSEIEVLIENSDQS